MRTQFPGYYVPDEGELTELWNDGLLILDANTLLNLYRYTDETRDQFLAVLEDSRDRLWIPHQVGLEFHRNRLAVIAAEGTAYDSLIKAIATAERSLVAETLTHKRHSSMAAEQIAKTITTALATVTAELEKAREEHRLAAPAPQLADPVLNTITALFEDRVGAPFTDRELEDVYEEGRARYSKEIPPGYEDAKKGEPRCFGDLIIWKQILNKGEEGQRSAILITDDRKEDWWRIFAGQTLGPRVELVDEYMALTNHRVHFYTPEQFLRFANGQQNERVSESSLGEVEQVSNLQASEEIRRALDSRRVELAGRRNELANSLARVEANVARGKQQQELEQARSILRKELERAEHNLGALTAMTDRHNLLANRDPASRARPDNVGELGREIHEASMEAEKTIAQLNLSLATIDAHLDNLAREGTVSKPNRLDTIRARIDEVDLALEDTDRALAALEGA